MKKPFSVLESFLLDFRTCHLQLMFLAILESSMRDLNPAFQNLQQHWSVFLFLSTRSGAKHARLLPRILESRKKGVQYER